MTKLESDKWKTHQTGRNGETEPTVTSAPPPNGLPNGLVEYTPGSAFPGRIGRTIKESSPAWPEPLRVRPDAPNVLCIVLDDTGFGQLGCYGSPIRTPNI